MRGIIRRLLRRLRGGRCDHPEWNLACTIGGMNYYQCGDCHGWSTECLCKDSPYDICPICGNQGHRDLEGKPEGLVNATS